MTTNAGGVMRSFNIAPGAEVPRSVFNRSHSHKTTIDSGYLYPILCDELLPGDTFTLRENLFGRLTTPVVPVMHPMHIDTFYFAVPIRLLWENWDKFHGAEENPGDYDPDNYETPRVTCPSGGFSAGSLYDYIGIPPDVDIEWDDSNNGVIAFYTRAYNLIWNEWFRDQDLQDSVTVDTDDGPDTSTDYVLLRRGKRHDYFTSARPWTQKGPQVELPLGTSAPVVSDGTTNTPTFTNGSAVRQLGYQGSTVDTTHTEWGAGSGSIPTSGGYDPVYWSATGLQADLSSATAATVNELREAFQIQKVYERDARSGTRYVEHLKSHWGVYPPDYRLQRPEFLGGSRSQINVNPVAQTAQRFVSNDPPPGDLSAFASVFSDNGFVNYSADEHCVILGLVNFRVDLAYQQGVHRKFMRQDRFDYYLPALAHIGEQAVLKREIYADAADQDSVWGYQEAWAEYRYAESRVSSIMRSDHPESLDYWHLALDFATEPNLNSTFIEDEPPVDRIIAYTSMQYATEMQLDTWFDIKHARPMPTFSVPGLIDHF